MATTTITKIILERNGEEREAYPVSDAELLQFKEKFQAMNRDISDCNCGDEVCIDGYVWRCSYGPTGNCQWFKSDWQCQP